MRFTATSLEGACLVEPEPHQDDRGIFARTFCAKEFHDQGLVENFVQCNTSWNVQAGTIRGIHYQLAPALEAKLVRCTAGSLWDVIVDLRPNSRTYLQHFGVELTARDRKALYVPKMFGHGFQTLEDGSEVFYQISEFYSPKLTSGMRYDDPALAIRWPLPVTSISRQDLTWSFLDKANPLKPTIA
ncbi:MAG TPA: dTDP-4-dehydrorhamnose 3,5-epimerase [Chthoniobacterales bacterium]|jgi:dTDP-4-dehydrorhamnose 3,5-epimerase|nr:dTDP-4-dehydrorhamnose 3,5-epimerase [Chthoniobacterales bacterium]